MPARLSRDEPAMTCLSNVPCFYVVVKRGGINVPLPPCCRRMVGAMSLSHSPLPIAQTDRQVNFVAVGSPNFQHRLDYYRWHPSPNPLKYKNARIPCSLLADPRIAATTSALEQPLLSLGPYRCLNQVVGRTQQDPHNPILGANPLAWREHGDLDGSIRGSDAE